MPEKPLKLGGVILNSCLLVWHEQADYYCSKYPDRVDVKQLEEIEKILSDLYGKYKEQETRV